MTVRTLVVDDQDLIRAGLVALLRAAPGIDVVGEATDGARAVELAADTRPHVVLMDIRMPVLDGIEATRQILATPGEHRPRIVVLTTFDIDEYVYTALGAGASGFLLKDTPPDRIIAAIHTVAGGDLLIAPRITRRLIEAFAQHHRTQHHRAGAAADTRLGDLTPREREVLRLVGTGLTNAQIAEQFVIEESTVKTHVKRTMSKLRLTSRAQAVVVAYETGLIVPTATPGTGRS